MLSVLLRLSVPFSHPVFALSVCNVLCACRSHQLQTPGVWVQFLTVLQCGQTRGHRLGTGGHQPQLPGGNSVAGLRFGAPQGACGAGLCEGALDQLRLCALPTRSWVQVCRFLPPPHCVPLSYPAFLPALRGPPFSVLGVCTFFQPCLCSMFAVGESLRHPGLRVMFQTWVCVPLHSRVAQKPYNPLPLSCQICRFHFDNPAPRFTVLTGLRRCAWFCDLSCAGFPTATAPRREPIRSSAIVAAKRRMHANNGTDYGVTCPPLGQTIGGRPDMGIELGGCSVIA